MNERLVEDWLNKANERSYQIPFAQALVSEGMQVLRVGHSSHEHGKDIIAIDSKGKVHAYQLKDGDLDLKGFEKGFGQLTALVETQVEHPAISGTPRHQPWLVISGEASIPVEDRIRVHNIRWLKKPHTPLKLMTGTQMLAKFLKMSANFWPQNPEDSRSLLSLYLTNGKEALDRKAFSKLIAGILDVNVKGKVNKADVTRRLSAANFFASYALSPFYAEKNNWELVQGWVITAAHIAWAADKAKLNDKQWHPTFRLAIDEALEALKSLADEALQPDAFYPRGFELDTLTRSRCTICAGAIAAKILIARSSGNRWEQELLAKEKIEHLFSSGRLFLWGESGVPFFLTIIWALDNLRGDQFSDGILFSILSAIAHQNSNPLMPKLPNPYNSTDDSNAKFLKRLFDGEKAMELQATSSYTLESLVMIAAKRMWRGMLTSVWAQITKIDLARLIPDHPRDLFLWDWGNKCGSNELRKFQTPQSWRELLVQARLNEDNALPSTLKKEFDFAILFTICYPHRLTTALVKHIDNKSRLAVFD